MKKRLALLAMTVLTVSALFSGCQAKSKDDSDKDSDTQKVIATKDIVKSVSDKLTLPDMQQNGSTDDLPDGTSPQDVFEYLCDIDYEKVDEFYISYATDSKADEVFVIRLKDKGDADTAKEELLNRVQKRKTQFQSYVPAEVPKIDNAKVETDGKYAILVINDSSSEGISAFKDAIK